MSREQEQVREIGGGVARQRLPLRLPTVGRPDGGLQPGPDLAALEAERARVLTELRGLASHDGTQITRAAYRHAASLVERGGR